MVWSYCACVGRLSAEPEPPEQMMAGRGIVADHSMMSRWPSSCCYEDSIHIDTKTFFNQLELMG
jgi:hypothetical protein